MDNTGRGENWKVLALIWYRKYQVLKYNRFIELKYGVYLNTRHKTLWKITQRNKLNMQFNTYNVQYCLFEILSKCTIWLLWSTVFFDNPSLVGSSLDYDAVFRLDNLLSSAYNMHCPYIICIVLSHNTLWLSTMDT